MGVPHKKYLFAFASIFCKYTKSNLQVQLEGLGYLPISVLFGVLSRYFEIERNKK